MSDATTDREAILDAIAEALWDASIISYDDCRPAAEIALAIIEKGGKALPPPEPVPWSDPGIVEKARWPWQRRATRS